MNNENIFSTKFQSGNRTYFLDVKLTKDGDRYLKISENKRIEESEFERHQIIVFEEGIDKLAEKITEVAKKIRAEEKSYSLEDKRKTHRNAYQPWTDEDDNRLELLYCEGKSVTDLSKEFGRNNGAIQSRIKKLELKEKYGTQHRV
ncbi:MAG: PUR family DNA/RNA-binding protein [Bacteroidetes bacterium]|nr:PUR family DNA/RNA-binding protein [Bacteroidota bacterium]